LEGGGLMARWKQNYAGTIFGFFATAKIGPAQQRWQ